jgi:hypothetical protein
MSIGRERGYRGCVEMPDNRNWKGGRDYDCNESRLDDLEKRMNTLEHQRTFVLGIVACVSVLGSVLSFILGWVWK